MSQEEKNLPEEKTEPRRERPRGRFTARLAFLMSLAALVISGYLGYELYYRQPDLLRTDVVSATRTLKTEVEQLKEARNTSNYDIKRLKESQETLIEAMRKTSQSLGKSRVNWILAETEQLMIVANQRLQLAGDIETATLALEIADERLRDLSDPDLTPVRKILAKEIQSLKSAERPDIAGISLRLGALSDSVASLPLSLEFQQAVQSETAAEETKTAEKETARPVVRNEKPGFFAELWADVMSVISIRTNVQSYKPLLPPEQQYYLRENLRLMILGAQQAALRADTQTYATNLKLARGWAEEYFDTRSQALAQLVQELDKLSNAKLSSAKPRISESLKALRAIARKKAGL
jgi:uroporphyrin-3 C-methyltransferase